MSAPSHVLPEKQKAWVIVRRGKPADALVFDENATVPSSLAEGEVLVKVQAAAFNPVYVPHRYSHAIANLLICAEDSSSWGCCQISLRSGHTLRSTTLPVPSWTRTARASRTDRTSGASYPSVRALPLNYTFLQLSTHTTAGLKIKTKQGALSQYARVPATHIALRPAHIKPTEAAGLGLAGYTAHEALFSVGQLEPGQNLFVNGGTTAVGIYAIQLAKAIGCRVTVTGSGKRKEFLTNLGVDRVSLRSNA